MARRPQSRYSQNTSHKSRTKQFPRTSDSEGDNCSAQETLDTLDTGLGAADDKDDVDIPRVAQWIAEDDLGEDEDVWDEEDELEPPELKSLRNDLSGLPLGALRKAQQILTHATTNVRKPELEDDSEEPEISNPKGKEKARPEWNIKPRSHVPKRSNKHAPIEVTSKKPVTRKRTVVAVKAVQSCDPRFLPLAGEFSAEKFRKSYGFLEGTRKTELQTLQETLKRAQKLLASSPQHVYDERDREVKALELAVKRIESLVDKDRREKVEQEALRNLMKEEQERRKKGKGEWHFKKSDKRELLVRARYEALTADGGKRAVRKAIDKKRKKVGQKEKKSRPYPKEGLKRGFGYSGDGGREKRRRVE